MAFALVEDTTSQIETVFFPSIYQKYKELIRFSKVLIISAKVSVKGDDSVNLLCESISEPQVDNTSKKDGLYIKFKNETDSNINAVRLVLTNMIGNIPIYFFFEKEKKLVMLPKEKSFNYTAQNIEQIKEIVGEKNVAIKQ